MSADGSHHLAEAPTSPEVDALFQDDIDDLGYVMNATRLWAHRPSLITGLFDLMSDAARAADLDVRKKGVLVAATASTIGDSYCSLAWGKKLAAESDAELAAGVLSARDDRLGDAERALARWARKVAADANSTTTADIDELRSHGFTDAQILALTVYISLRLAFSTVNNALGARPDAELGATVPETVKAAVPYGRPILEEG
jgi:alkylhydroperoxidase family enzyme